MSESSGFRFVRFPSLRDAVASIPRIRPSFFSLSPTLKAEQKKMVRELTDEAIRHKFGKFRKIRRLVYVDRKPRSLSPTDIPMCGCKKVEGTPGCTDSCQNRLLQIECHPSFCPCGDTCANQRFQNCEYPKLKVQSCGRKGLGLFAGEGLTAGQFITEYLGEVIHRSTLDERMQTVYAEEMRHTYFLHLDGAEVIDATQKGNESRFLNHSCGPNAVGRKWYYIIILLHCHITTLLHQIL
jgi:hypothetical protein